MEYTEQNFLTELEKMSSEELCMLTNIDIEEARKKNYTQDHIINSISGLFSMVS